MYVIELKEIKQIQDYVRNGGNALGITLDGVTKSYDGTTVITT